ncbi:MAG: hypothetical protein IT419_10095 [Planctomycetes bacterium]|nr:hypothetical protein [Planctomycetota bacterium]OQY96260.1 MAG: hypothetical protein B6D36_19750 [Planctomycetes bacterium UTPLA1]
MPCLIEEDVSATKTKIPLADAEAHAKRLRDLFDGCYERWEFAGSIRRRRPEVGDIDHVVISKWIEVPNDLFGTMRLESAMAIRAHELWRDRILIIRSTGDRRTSVTFEGVPHELYYCFAENWGPILAIRTGSSDFARCLVTRLRRRGHRQHEGYLHRVLDHCTGRFNESFGDGQFGERLDCPTEEAYFAAAGLNASDWPPTRREVGPT